MPAMMTQAEYARHRGCSQVAVHKAVKAGRISLIDGSVDPTVADIQWRANTRARIGEKPRPEVNGSPGGPGARDARSPSDEPDSGGDYWASRARREAAEAQLAELKLAEQQGELVRADQVKSAVARRAAGLRESLLQLPARLSPVLAAESDVGKIHDLLHAELRQALEQVTAAD